MEKEEFIATSLNKFEDNYYGGNYNIVNREDDEDKGNYVDYNKIKYIQHTMDGSGKKVIMETESGKKSSDEITFIDNKYYAINNKYGTFLCTYEKGKEEQEVLFSN